MRKNNLLLFARQVYANACKNKANRILAGILGSLFLYAAWSGFATWQQQTRSRAQYQQQVWDNWEKMPDKHPHRMAHYGYFAFRPKHSLSFFDFGMESYTGNAVFLEAHRQNTINFSEAGLSTGMLRFGEISMAMILQVLLPLVIFFIGFTTVATDRENGTLKILLSQGASWREIIFGKSLGLLGIGLTVLLPVMLVLLAGCIIIQGRVTADECFRIGWISLSYALYLGIISLITVLVSSVSSTAKLSLVSLIGIWLLFTIIIPRTTQAVGKYLYATPSKIEFESAIEKDLIKKGDSHDPNDPYYKALKDSILTAYKADSIQQLPFNYSGFQMKQGERISAEIYDQHLKELLHIYDRQNNVSKVSAFIDPFTALRNFSMAMSGTDFNAYTGFQQQAETYRYKLAQHMNELQIRLISNKEPADHDKPHNISAAWWRTLPVLEYKKVSQWNVLSRELISLAALLGWALALVAVAAVLSRKIKSV